jgi:hypothetical protein
VYIELVPGEKRETKVPGRQVVVSDEIVGDLDVEGCPVGIDLYQYATNVADLSKLEAEGSSFGLVPAEGIGRGNGLVMPAIEGYETTTQSVERFGAGPSQVCRYCEQGRIPGIVKVATRWLIPKILGLCLWASGAHPSGPSSQTYAMSGGYRI